MSGSERRAGGDPMTNSNTNATNPDASTPAALHAAGLAHLRAGRKLDAQLCCQQSLAIDPGHSDTLHLMGLLCLDANQHDHAVEWIARAIQQDARAEYLTSFGNALQQQGRYEDALKAFDKAVQLRPGVGELWKNLGNVLLDLKRPDDALLSFQHALKLTPRLWYAAHQCGILLYNAGRFEEAVPVFDHCVEQQPGHVPSLQLRALSLKGLKRYEEALAQNHQAYAVDPDNADTCNNIGDVLHLLDRHDEALRWFDRAIAAQPGYILPINNKAFLLGQMHRFEEAIAIYEGLQRDGINTPTTDWNLSLLYMMTGNFEAGWRGREARWKANVLAVTYPHFEQKMWLGEGSIDGKTVLIHADEGLGDCIQFARYIPEVAARGARVILAVAEPIRALLSGLPGVSECLPLPGGPLPSFDLHCPLSSLPLAFNTRLETIPAATSYLPRPSEDRVRVWESRLGPHDKLRVGLVWSGNPAHGNDRNRSTSLRTLSCLFDLDATFVSLQKNPRASDQEGLRNCPEIIDITADLADFGETAALVSCLDLVITVDTSVAHLAPALGCPTWILLPYTPDYRWLLDREDSPWYPTARLFRQSARRDYREVLDRVRSELAALIAQRKGTDPAFPPTPADSTPEDLSSLGITLHQAGRHNEALNAFDGALRLAPGDAEAWKNRGNVLIDLKRPADAVLSFERAVRLDPRHWDAAYRCGFLLYELGRHAEAIVYFDLVDRLRPNQAVILEIRAAVLHRLKRFDEALADNQRAHALNPANANTCNNIGAALQVLGRDGEALPWFERAVALRPDYVEALTNKAASLQQLHRFDEAAATYRQAKAIDPGEAETDWNLSLLQLLTGNFEEGWRGREARWSARRAETSLTFPGPRWRGEENIAGKTILIYMDEGLGDAIQFARYVPDVAARGAHVILLVLPAVYPLLSKLPGVAQCIPFSAAGPRPAFDMHCPMSSLPLMFGTRLDTIPSSRSYLPPPPQPCVQVWEDRLGRRDKLRIGLVWAGNPDHKNDHNRSTSLRALSRLFDLDATFISLQKDPRPEDQATLRQHPGVIDLAADLTDFSETAALVSCLDLVITVDTSVAHLAAALGRPTWILLPYTPDYRWLLDREDSPWYPTTRLFRQSPRRDYGEVLDRVRSALIRKICERQTVNLGPPDEALPGLQRAVELDPRDWDAASKCGVALHKMGRFQEAHAYFDLCNELRPDQATTLYLRGRASLDLGRLEEALADSQRAHELDPLNLEICNSIGAILRAQGHEQLALPWFDRAIRLQPNNVPALTNRAVCLGQLQRFDEAFAAYARIRALDSDNAQAAWNLALLQLLTGNFEDGWAGREARWNIAARPRYPAFTQPMWLGKESVDGKTIVIYADEGLGDIIHFARYIPMVAARGARVLLVVDPAAVSLLSELPGVSQCFSKARAALPAIDMHCPISSLPLAFATRLETIPADTAYLPSPPAAHMQAWEQRLSNLEKSHHQLRVGLVWSGNARHQNDHNRSMQLRMLSRVLDVEATFVSLQKDPRPADKAMLLERPDIIDLTAGLHDFSETAALIKCLDLVITVDTSVAHLAAALGCPTWILLPYTPDYRWLLDREDSPWYPTARLFRQSARRDYGEVLDRVRDELATLISQRRAADHASATAAATPAALCETGMEHRRAGGHGDAGLCCDKALAADSSHAGALHLMGLLSLDAGQHDRALDWISSAIRQDPRPEYLSNLGFALQQAERHEEALNVFDKAVQLKPDDAALWRNLGDTLMELQRTDEALLSFEHALKLDPLDCDAAYKILFVLHALGRFEQALTHFDRYDALRPDHVPGLQLRALSLRGLRLFEEAVATNQRAIALDPGNADLRNNLGDALQSLGRREEALQWFERAVELRPDLIPALRNMAFVLTQLHRFAEAIAAYQRVLVLDPANAAAECDLAQLHLLTGDFEAGWAGREARWKLATT
ncbi:MAG TPA: tetratricopeptide repeat protein, partial [Bradyrhizobium sp.]